MFKQMLFFLPTFPDAPSEQAMNSVGFLARASGARLTAFIPQLSEEPSTWPAIVGAFPLNFPQLMQESVRSSERNAELLSGAMTKVSSEFSVTLDLRRNLASLYGSPQPLVDLARLHDLTVLPIPETDCFDRKYLEAVLFESGRPALLMPSGNGGKPLQRLKTIVVAWDFGREATRAISDALPLLKLAKQVHVLTVLGEKHIQTTSKTGDLEKYLSSHSVKFVLDETELKGRSIGGCLCAHVSDVHADMLVMGAYGHSRFREFALGGATRTLIADAAVPVLMSH